MSLRSMSARVSSASPEISRSEEHTSELQSQSNLVCRLLLEKKKNKTLKHIFYKNKRNTLKTYPLPSPTSFLTSIPKIDIPTPILTSMCRPLTHIAHVL